MRPPYRAEWPYRSPWSLLRPDVWLPPGGSKLFVSITEVGWSGSVFWEKLNRNPDWSQDWHSFSAAANHYVRRSKRPSSDSCLNYLFQRQWCSKSRYWQSLNFEVSRGLCPPQFTSYIFWNLSFFLKLMYLFEMQIYLRNSVFAK